MNLDDLKGHPAMDYREHAATYRGFVRGFVWTSVLVALLLAFMAATLV